MSRSKERIEQLREQMDGELLELRSETNPEVIKRIMRNIREIIEVIEFITDARINNAKKY